jgi:2-keto-4-pentenoate hydratase/2-oxohepta-3-ene-1,7-dioic acid hydratase in catechol pathway
MDMKRRDILKVGASALGGMLAGQASVVQAQSNDLVTVQSFSGKAGLRIANFVPRKGSTSRLGIVTDNASVIDIPAEAVRQHQKLVFDATSMISFLNSGDRGLAQVQYLVAKASKTQLSLHQVKLLSPIPKPQSNIYAVGWNYVDHFEEGLKSREDKSVKEYPKVPVFFSKGTQTMNGPFDPIPYDASYSTSIDWEAEIAVIIGKKGKNIPEENAMDYVFGYAAYNDTTARDVQQKRHSGQWFKGKSLDGHGPMGPWIVTAGAVNLDETRVISRVNGIEKQNASYKQMYFKIPVIISELSKGLTLLPGDIIATGTPSGVGYSRKPPEFLRPGDVMETEITGVGILRNTIANS